MAPKSPARRAAPRWPDAGGRFGDYGGRYVPETLIGALETLEATFREATEDPTFEAELASLHADFGGRPTPLYRATRLERRLGPGVRLYLKREDLVHTGAHKLNNALEQILRLLPPFIPFLTEELWGRLGAQCPQRGLDEALPVSELLIHARFPTPRAELRDEEVEAEFELLQQVVRAARDVRAKYTVSPKLRLDAAIQAKGQDLARLEVLSEQLISQAGLGTLTLGEAPERPGNAAKAVVGEVQVFLGDVLDPVKERKRLEGQKAKLVKNIQGLEKRLGNPRFAEKAPAEVVEKVKADLAEAQGQLAGVEEGLAELG